MPSTTRPAPDARTSMVDIRPQTCTHRQRTIEEWAAGQHGVVARWQLAAAGVTPSMLKTGIAAGRLLRLHRGVYAVGHAHLTREGRWLAAVLAVGSGAVLSHRDAAGLHDLRPANHERIDVTTTQRGRRNQPRIRVHHTAELHPLDVTTRRGVPVTSVARTIVDLASVVPKDSLAKAINEAERQHAFDLTAVEEALARTRTRNGTGHAKLRAVLVEAAADGLDVTRSELEDRFLALLQRHGLPRPKTNVWVGPHEVDALWPTHRLAVELDGWASHHTRRAFQHDRTKANALQAKGLRVLRYTYGDVVRRPAEVAGEVRGFLTA
jgi:predicted transcriptional regulator of viral defense system